MQQRRPCRPSGRWRWLCAVLRVMQDGWREGGLGVGPWGLPPRCLRPQWHRHAPPVGDQVWVGGKVGVAQAGHGAVRGAVRTYRWSKGGEARSKGGGVGRMKGEDGDEAHTQDAHMGKCGTAKKGRTGKRGDGWVEVPVRLPRPTRPRSEAWGRARAVIAVQGCRGRGLRRAARVLSRPLSCRAGRCFLAAPRP